MSVQCLDQFDVSLRPDEPARLLAWEGEPEAPARWSLWSGELGENFVGALAVEAPAGAPQVEWE